MTFEVLDDTGAALVTEPFTLVLKDCADSAVADLYFDPNGPIVDQVGSQSFVYDWNVSGNPTYQMTVQPPNHDSTVCGTALTISVTADDADFGNYASFDDTTGVIDFNFALRTSQVQDQTT